MNLMLKIKELYKKIPNRIIKVMFNIGVAIVFTIALMPVIAWYAGLLGLAYLVYQGYVLYIEKKINLEDKTGALRDFFKTKANRTAFYIVLFGIIIHGSCRIHSQVLINDLYNQAIHEKNIIINNTDKK